MTRFAPLRKTLGIALLACALTLPALLMSQVAGPHTALASVGAPFPPLDGTWVSTDPRISSLQVTRQQSTSGGTLRLRFVVQAFHGTRNIGTGSTAWAASTAFNPSRLAVTVTGPCAGVRLCPDLQTDLNLATVGAHAAFLVVDDHTLNGVVHWTENLSQL